MLHLLKEDQDQLAQDLKPQLLGPAEDKVKYLLQ